MTNTALEIQKPSDNPVPIQEQALASEFELYQAVTLMRGGKKYNTRITRRYYNPDLKKWYYEVAIDPTVCLIPPSNLSPRNFPPHRSP